MKKKLFFISLVSIIFVGCLGISMKKHEIYGSWKSPISATMIAQGALRFSEITALDQTIYWLEGRPEEQGRVVLMSWSKHAGEKELLPKEYSVRTKVHEYGGGALLVTKQHIYFVNNKDQQIYCLNNDNTITKITSRPTARFADGCQSSLDSSLFYVMEEHDKEVVNSMVKIDLQTGTIQTVASGNDFYSHPRISPDGTKLAYITWNHPNLPWDETELWCLDIATGIKTLVAGGVQQSVTDPKWSPDGQLYYVSDCSNWWNIYCAKDHKLIWAIDAEFTLPQWAFGRSLIGFSGDTLVCSYIQNGVSTFAKIAHNGTITPIDLPYTDVKGISVQNNLMAMIAGSPAESDSIIAYDLTTHTTTVIKRSNSLAIDKTFIPTPITLAFPTTHGTAHAFYYPPCNPHYAGTYGEKPPLIVYSHGGPTGHVAPRLSLDIVYWTSRGFAIVDVNYGGSTGYGRKYRDLLKGQWGVIDVDDCTNAALYCVQQGLADPQRLTIKGGSAGGFTTLAALAKSDTFKAGANYYGVADLERLASDTHKFEARYLDKLIGPYPETKNLYIERSPINNINNITSPVIIFQGDEDAVVPPSQSEAIYKSLVERNIATAYLLYKGEQHGFRKAENIIRSLEAQLYFFAKVLGFPLHDDIEPVEILNLKE